MERFEGGEGGGCSYPTQTGYLVGPQPERRVQRSEKQTPQWVMAMSTSVSSQVLGVKGDQVRGEVGEWASQPWKVVGGSVSFGSLVRDVVGLDVS